MKIKNLTNLLIFTVGLISQVLSLKLEDEYPNNNKLNQYEGKLSLIIPFTIVIQNLIKNYSILALNKLEDNFYTLHNQIRVNYKIEYPLDIVLFIFLGFVLKYILGLFRSKVYNTINYVKTFIRKLLCII